MVVRITGPSIPFILKVQEQSDPFILKSLKQDVKLSSYGFTDSNSISEDLSLQIQKYLFDAVIIFDSTNVAVNRQTILSDSSIILDLIGVDDGITYGLHKYFYNDITVLDSLSAFRGRGFGDSSSITELSFYNLGKNLSESLISSELASLSLSLIKTDSAVVSELVSLNPGKVFVDSISSPTDVINSLAFGKNLFDNATAEDLVLVPDGLTYTFAKSLSEILSATEVFQREVAFSRTFSDSSIVTESILTSTNYNRGFADSSNATESIVVSQGFIRFFNDSSTITDNFVFVQGKGLRFDSDFVLAVDSDGILVSQGWGRPSGDSAAASEVISLVVAFNRLFADSSNATELLSLDFGKSLSDSSLAAESIALEPNKVLADSIASPTDVINSFAFGKNLGDSSLIIETSVYTFGKTLGSEILSPIDEPVFTVGTSLVDSSTIEQAISLQVSILKSDSSTIADNGILFVQNYFAEDYIIFKDRYVETSNTIF